MKIAQIEYLGELRTKATHLKSGQSFITDAPPDNQGLGAYFSPTDTTSTSLGCCMLTLMGIAARAHQIDFAEVTVDVEKIMGTEPRRIVGVGLTFHFGKSYTEKERKILERAALTCPVAMSLHPDLHQDVKFLWKN